MDRRLGAVVLAAASLLAGAARASGPGWLSPWYVDQFGGDPADQRALYDGRLGIVMARTPRPQLLIAWRLLHGRAVGQVAGEALSRPCCNGPVTPDDAPPSGTQGWLAARKLIPGAPVLDDYMATDRDGEDYTVVANCFDEAFDKATATLKDRAGRYGAGSPAVRAWLDGQDAVFRSCHDTDVKLPAPMADAPAWLAADRAYQEAAFALYDGRYDEAAGRFAAIAKDATSPWAASGTYLVARTRLRAALIARTPEGYAAAHAAIRALAQAPAGSFGQGEVRTLERMLEYRERPGVLMARLDAELGEALPTADIAVAFRDYQTLGAVAADPPETIDWMRTLTPQTDPARVKAATDGGEESLAAEARLGAAARAGAAAHARARWAAGHDVAWLIAALSLVDPGAPEAAGLAADALAVPADHPGWLSAQHHLARLTLATVDPAVSRARLDVVLTRRDLSVSDRNVFTAARAQVARIRRSSRGWRCAAGCARTWRARPTACATAGSPARTTSPRESMTARAPQERWGWARTPGR